MLNLGGLLIGISTFLIIGMFHPVTVKAEYYWGTKCWWIFLLLGIACLPWRQDVVVRRWWRPKRFVEAHCHQAARKPTFPKGSFLEITPVFALLTLIAVSQVNDQAQNRPDGKQHERMPRQLGKDEGTEYKP